MINVGIIGSGFIVPFFIETVKLVGGYRCAGIAARNEEAMKKLQEKYGIGYCTTDYDELFSDPSIDVVYVALPNGLHYEYGKRALEHGKHVIMEKPFTSSYAQAKELIDLAWKKGLIIFDAVTMIHMPNYEKIRKLLDQIGEIKIVDINFSQYSSRYDKFKNGITLPAFDWKLAGGALMDLGIYNINFAVGLFGMPKKVSYYANMRKKVDTSGVLVLDYGSFKVSAVSAKDCKAPAKVSIQGDRARIESDEASSVIRKIALIGNDGSRKEFELNKHPDVFHYHEYVEFKHLFNKKDMEKAREYNVLTLDTIRVLDKALKSAGISFGK